MNPNSLTALYKLSISAFAVCSIVCSTGFAKDNTRQSDIQEIVDKSVKPLMLKNDIPGIAIGISINGESYFLQYGIASKETKQLVDPSTLFEIGSITKTFNATLASYANENGQLKLTDSPSQYLPILRGSDLDAVSLINLGTHTAGHFPLQLPDDITNDDQLMNYYRHWRPVHTPGTYRTYSNPGIGLLGITTAASMHRSYDDALEKMLLPALFMPETYIHVPADKMKNYAQGYTKNDEPVRVHPAMLSSETYAIKTTVVDLLHFIDINMGQVPLDENLQRAVNATHTGYFKVGLMTQDLVWEQYPETVTLKELMSANSTKMVIEDRAVTRLTPSLAPTDNVLLNKTGSTNGFGAYVLYWPAKKIGIVMLANKNYPNEDRVETAYTILRALTQKPEK